MKIKKTVEIEETICDICGITNDRTFMNNCSICGRDICTEHTYLITSLGLSTSVGKLCPDCFNERLKLKKEDIPKVNLDMPKRMSGPSIITQMADDAWRKIHQPKQMPTLNRIFGGEDGQD